MTPNSEYVVEPNPDYRKMCLDYYYAMEKKCGNRCTIHPFGYDKLYYCSEIVRRNGYWTPPRVSR